MTTLLFVRHGHYDSEGCRTPAEKKVAPLTPRGEEDVRTTARYLMEHGIRPDVALHSGTARTRQTAELVLEELGVSGVPTHDVGALFSNPAGFVKKWPGWVAACGIGPASVVLLVGHGTTQNALRREFEGPTRPPSAKEAYASALTLHVSVDGSLEGRVFFVGRRRSVPVAPTPG